MNKRKYSVPEGICTAEKPAADKDLTYAAIGLASRMLHHPGERLTDAERWFYATHEAEVCWWIRAAIEQGWVQ